ncbi:transposable element Tcb2 transposase [Trichonephila clavipes]|nr:transposable element Tcb2 transposase [Trichonephila clavipes]
MRNMLGKRSRRHLSQLSEFGRGLHIWMKIAGWYTRRVAGQVDRSECAVRNCWEQWKREGTPLRKTWFGATRKTTSRDDRRTVRQALVDPTVTRLRYKQTDESRFVLGTDDNRVRVWRHPGPFLNVLPGAIFQQDNSRPHTARVAQEFLHYFQSFPWPPRSSDLSPVEHVWDQLKWQMSSCHSVHDLELAAQDMWAHLPQDNIRCLINSMPDRVSACIAAGGGPTRY